MGAIKKPKKLKYPKKPKRGSSNQVKENYIKRCKEVDAKNKKRMSDYTKAIAKRSSLDKKIWG